MKDTQCIWFWMMALKIFQREVRRLSSTGQRAKDQCIKRKGTNSEIRLKLQPNDSTTIDIAILLPGHIIFAKASDLIDNGQYDGITLPFTLTPQVFSKLTSVTITDDTEAHLDGRMRTFCGELARS